jgi:hypothetical protein
VKPLFTLGQVVGTPGALAALERRASSRGIFFPVMSVVIEEKIHRKTSMKTSFHSSMASRS